MTAAFTPTAEQRAVIEHPLEPLRVSAGAGTGKTATVVARLVAAIDAGIQPEEALGITFTNKAAEELADRLRRHLPEHASEGREVEVDTYHGFALRILREFGAVVGVERGVDVVGPGYVRQLLRDSIGTEPYDHLDMTALDYRLDEAATLGAQASANLLDAAALVAAAPAAPADDVWLQRAELARILTGYEATKRSLGVVDFGDLIRLAFEVVDGNPDIAARIRARYRAVLLDEYQDTDPGQRRLLQAIFGDGFPVTAVGDDAQTIYEWRGASLANFTGFGRHFPRADGRPAETLPLTVNRRSGPTILAVANEVKGLLHGGTVIDPLQPAEDLGDHVGVGWFRTEAEEAAWIAGEIRRLHDEDGVPWREIAVLFRRHRSIAPVRIALVAAEIPHEVVALGGLIEVPEVADVHAWLRVLARPDDSVALARILLGSRYRLGLGDLAPLTRWMRSQRGADPDLPYPMLEAVDRDEAVTAPHVADLLEDFRRTYRRLLADAQHCTLVDLIRRVVDAVDGWAEIEAMPEVAGVTARLNLYRFLDLAEGWSPLAGRPSLEAFLGYLDLLAEDRTAAELDTATVGGEDAVALLTVHRAKGLEWEAVFVPALASEVFPGRSLGFDNPVEKSRWLPYELRLDASGLPPLEGKRADVTEGLREHHRRGELRAAYVAVTRARRLLAMTGSVWGRRATPYAPSELLELARAVPGAEEVTWVDDPGEHPGNAFTGVAAAPAAAPDPHFGQGWREALLEAAEQPDRPLDTAAEAARGQLALMLDGLPAGPPMTPPPPPATSVTGLVTLASCPRRFYWSEVDPLPRRPASWLRRGSDLHRRIELHHAGVRPLDEIEPDSPSTAEAPPFPGSDPFEVFRASRFAAARPVLTETPIDLELAGTRVRGRIDAVFEPEPGWWEIVDWKSGRPAGDPSAVVQLEAYAVAAAKGGIAGRRPDRITAGFVHLGTDPATETMYEADAPWLEAAETRLAVLASRVAGDDYPATPGDACGRCDFLHVCPAGRAHLAAGS